MCMRLRSTRLDRAAFVRVAFAAEGEATGKGELSAPMLLPTSISAPCSTCMCCSQSLENKSHSGQRPDRRM